MIITCHKNTAEPRKTPPKSLKSLLNAPGLQVGQSIEWAHGNAPADLTAAEIDAIRHKCRVKDVNVPRALEIKRLMNTRTLADIVRMHKGRRGWSRSTVAHIHAALSECRGSGQP